MENQENHSGCGSCGGCGHCKNWTTHRVLKVVLALSVLAIVFATGVLCGRVSGRYNRGYGMMYGNRGYFNDRYPGGYGMMKFYKNIPTTESAPATDAATAPTPTK